MEIKLKPRLSAYSRFPNKLSDEQCNTEVVTREDIDSLFDTTILNNKTKTDKKSNDTTVSKSDIDSLFN